MKRFHVHVAVPDLHKSIAFYSTVFGSEPSVVKHDYAKWMLEDPRINFAISQRDAARAGVSHLGFQVESDTELEEVHARLQAAEADIFEEKNVSCCYARGDKYWVKDPSGVAWESFHTLGSAPVYGGAQEQEPAQQACGTKDACGPKKTACCG